MDRARAPENLDIAELIGPVRRATGSANLEVADWSCRPLRVPLNDVTGGVYRVSGTGNGREGTVIWSIVLKIVHHAGSLLGPVADLADASYWKREALVYGSGLLDDVLGMRAPRCYGVVVRLGYTAAAAVRYGLTHTGMMALDPQVSARLERSMGHTIGEILDRWAMLQAFLHDRADEARELMADL